MESLSVLELLSASARIGAARFWRLRWPPHLRFSQAHVGLGPGRVWIAGGAMNAFMLPGQPTWLMMLDVALYLPMGWLGAMLVLRLKGPNV